MHQDVSKLSTVQVLMCYFHVVKNVKERTKTMRSDHEELILSDIKRMHYAMSRSEYDTIKSESYTKWRVHGLDEFCAYFIKQWDDNKFNRWQIFHTPAGFASTNNPVEASQTKRSKLEQAS